MMRGFLSVALLAALTVLGPACGGLGSGGVPWPTQQTPTATKAGVWKTYISGKNGFEFRYPEGCEVVEGDGAFSVGSRIELAIVESGGLGVADFADRFLNGKTKGSGWTIEARRGERIGGKEAVTVDYRFGGRNAFGTATFISGGATVYVWGLTAGGFMCDEATIYDTVVSSFRLTE